MTPPLLVELECPSCHARHWVIDSDFRASYMAGGVDVGYEERAYTCASCRVTLAGHKVVQKSPPAFLIGGEGMSAADSAHWQAILKQHFPDHPRAREIVAQQWWKFW